MQIINRIRHVRGVTTLVSGAAFALALGSVVAGPAAAQSAASSIDQPTPGTLPSGTSTTKGAGNARHEGNGQVAPPSAIQSSTDVMQSEGSVQGKTQGGRTDPIKHLPKDMR
ncbi:hypothetical protein [Methylobacterium sp. WL116]|uniref:hypothetical protein n=1 Tax=Methylobacterium sp. WL116 TaxID=2603889 RepID=UPI001FEF0A20|nr:hypothetical protein [Methylobacterium sp. WL116]